MSISCDKSLRKPGRAIESAGAPSKEAGSAKWTMTAEEAESQGFEDGYLGFNYDPSFKDRFPDSEVAMVYEIGYLKGSEQAEVDAEMADRDDWPPLG